ncbi:hypothetical protein SNE40_001956 [Patella caerulea]|uniref:GP-PDE domain-containing protein n=1 Tax=Patella caerulea TaxID=87958 RepID=A0AAN8KED2_PATCE
MVFVAVIGGYIITSLLLFRFPGLLHKKKTLKFRAHHISHRGGAGENLENTMTAFRHAARLGTQMLEIDCHISRDGQVVVAHDNNLERSCGQTIKITETDSCDLPKMKGRMKVDFEPNFILEAGEDRSLPLLKHVFDEFPDLPINIDIKIDNNELIAKVSDLVKLYNREEITAWGNRSDTICKKIYKENPNIPLLFSMKRVVVLILLFYSGLLPFVPLKESLLEIIMPSIILDENKFPMSLSRKQRFLVKFIDMLLMRPALFNHLNRRGIQTYIWVLNSEEDFEKAFKCNSTGVMTDFPTKLKAYLDEHPEFMSV